MSRALISFQGSPIPYPTPSVWRAAVNYITDADTLWVERDGGCRDSNLIELRVTGISWRGYDAAERFTEQGKLITARLRLLAPVGTIVRIETKPDPELYGRWLTPLLIPFAALQARLDSRFAPEFREPDIFTMDGIGYLGYAEHTVRNFPGAVWKTYK